MAAPKGNKFWLARSSHGRNPIFETPAELSNACAEYFQWAEDNPLYDTKVFHANGLITQTEVPKMRAMTISGMCLFLGISEDTWANYRNKKDFFGVTKEAEQVIYNQKFAGASADLLNANIIARDLGLSDKQERKHSGSVGLTDLSEDELDRKLQQLDQELKQSERE